MRNTLLALFSTVAIIIIAGCFFIAFKYHITGLAAQLISANNDSARFLSCTSQLGQTKIASKNITQEQINTDNTVDAVIKYDDKKQCGNAGCVYELCVSNSNGSYDRIPFGFAAHSLKIEQTVTNGMHDIELNGDSDNTLVWNGSSYALNAN